MEYNWIDASTEDGCKHLEELLDRRKRVIGRVHEILTEFFIGVHKGLVTTEYYNIGGTYHHCKLDPSMLHGVEFLDPEESSRLKAKIDYIHQSYATTYHRLHQWMRENAPDDVKNEYFSIIANGTVSPFEQPTYAQQFNTLLHKIEAYEKAFDNESKREEILSFWRGRALYEIIDDPKVTWKKN